MSSRATSATGTPQHVNQLQSYKGRLPQLGAGCYLHPSAQVIGEVTLGNHVSIWPGVVMRGDVNRIVVGDNTNIQDLSMLHVTHRRAEDPEGAPVIIGRNVTIGHSVVLHGCTIGDECLIGIGSIILDRAIIEARVMIGAGSLVSPGKVLKSGYLYMGRPARQVRPLTEAEIANFSYSAAHYCRLKDDCLAEPGRTDPGATA